MSTTDNFLISEAHLNLAQARKEKAERIKDLGEPIELPGTALAFEIHDGVAWIAENTTVVRKLNLETGKTLNLYQGHTGPVTSLAFCDKKPGSGKKDILVTGSWDKSIKLWDIVTKQVISTTPNAHEDFVKSLHVFPTLRLLVSGSSDKLVRFWDLSYPESSEPLKSLGSISSHTRPVECLAGEAVSPTSAILYTGDTMGIIKVWDLHKDESTPLRWTATLKRTIAHHRTRINDLKYGNSQLWTASADETVRVLPEGTTEAEEQAAKLPKPLTHPVAVRTILPLLLTDLAEPYLITAAGDVLRIYDVSSLDKPELVGEVDAHWHDIVSLRLWIRKTESEDGQTRVEPWVVTTSLDKTIRKWKLSYLLNPPPPVEPQPAPNIKASQPPGLGSDITEEEERELAELMGSDEE